MICFFARIGYTGLPEKQALLFLDTRKKNEMCSYLGIVVWELIRMILGIVIYFRTLTDMALKRNLLRMWSI